MSKARFVIRRPESPEWFAGWDPYHDIALWVCDAGDAMFVRPDELEETMARLAKEMPLASLYLPAPSKPSSPETQASTSPLSRSSITPRSSPRA
jgi:hypothetical protein